MSIGQTVTLQVRNVYGRNKAYPICDKAKIFANMLGTKTLTKEHRAHIVSLGYGIYTVDSDHLDMSEVD